LIVAENRQYLGTMPQEYNRSKPDRSRANRQKQKNRRKVRAFVQVIAAFAVALLIISRFAVISEYNYGIRNLKRELQELQKTNERLSLQLAQAQDINWIEEYATTHLGMIYPDNRDIVYIAVEDIQDEDSHFQITEEKPEGRLVTDGWIAALIGKFNTIFH